MNLKIGINGIVFSNPMTLQLNKLINEHNEEIETFSNYSLKFIVNTFPFGGSVKHDMIFCLEEKEISTKISVRAAI